MESDPLRSTRCYPNPDPFYLWLSDPFLILLEQHGSTVNDSNNHLHPETPWAPNAGLNWAKLDSSCLYWLVLDHFQNSFPMLTSTVLLNIQIFSNILHWFWQKLPSPVSPGCQPNGGFIPSLTSHCPFLRILLRLRLQRIVKGSFEYSHKVQRKLLHGENSNFQI